MFISIFDFFENNLPSLTKNDSAIGAPRNNRALCFLRQEESGASLRIISVAVDRAGERRSTVIKRRKFIGPANVYKRIYTR